MPGARRSACLPHGWIACRTPTRRSCRSRCCRYCRLGSRRNASRRSMSSPSQRTRSERRSFDLRRSIPVRRSNPRRRCRPLRRSAPSKVSWFWRRSRPERDPPRSWISRSIDSEASGFRLSMAAVIRFADSLFARLALFRLPAVRFSFSKLYASRAKAVEGLSSRLTQRPPNGLGQASYRVGQWGSIVWEENYSPVCRKNHGRLDSPPRADQPGCGVT